MKIESTKAELREAFIAQVHNRLIGPTSPDEELQERPNKRYLTGMVFPQGASAAAGLADEQQDAEGADADDDQGAESPTDILFQKLPASVGVTFAISDIEQSLAVSVKAAAYEQVQAEIVAVSAVASGGSGQKRKAAAVWRRTELASGIGDEVITIDIGKDVTDIRRPRPVLGGRAEVRVYIRTAGGHRVATVVMVNCRFTPEETPVATEDILFQVGLSCAPACGIPAYPDPPSISPDPEAEELALQYRDMPAFAVGHGCGVFWPEPVAGIVSHVAVDFLPSVEVPPVTTAIASLSAATTEALSMKRLQDSNYNPVPAFRDLVAEYAAWSVQLANIDLDERFDEPRKRIVERIGLAVDRMSDGVDLLESNRDVQRVFRLTNLAMLLSLARSGNHGKHVNGTAFTDVDLALFPVDQVAWRPFQIAFFLISLRGLWDSSDPSRSIVDLIWFPTGGGKTEAYLGVAAFEMIRRRLMEGDAGAGTAVIKRYTLRLLTIQQFERAGS